MYAEVEEKENPTLVICYVFLEKSNLGKQLKTENCRRQNTLGKLSN